MNMSKLHQSMRFARERVVCHSKVTRVWVSSESQVTHKSLGSDFIITRKPSQTVGVFTVDVFTPNSSSTCE